MQNSIFQTDWWLDAVAPGSWRRLTVKQGASVVAAMPVVLGSKFGVPTCTMPPLTQFLGPCFAPPSAGTKYPTYLGQQKDWMFELIDQIPRNAYFAQFFRPEISNWQPFYWRGYSQTTFYTYILEDLSDLAGVFDGFQENIRRDVRKGEKKLAVEECGDASELLRIATMSFRRLGRSLPYSESTVERVVAAVLARDCGRVTIARDELGRVHAAMLYVWDETCTRYVIGGGDPDLRNSGATSLLMWDAIQHGARLNTSFDFEGSMLEPVERFVRGFGGVQTPYFLITKKHPLMAAAQHLRRK